MHVLLIAVGILAKLVYCFSCYPALYITQKAICNTALILLQNKPLGIWNSLTQESGFPKCIIMLGICKLGYIYYVISTKCINAEAMLTNDTNYSCHIKAVELVQPII